MRSLIGFRALIFISIFIISCNNKEDINKLVYKDFVYFTKNNLTKPFSGQVFRTQDRRNKTYVMSTYTLKHGIPNGTWKTFGYANEILQKRNIDTAA